MTVGDFGFSAKPIRIQELMGRFGDQNHFFRIPYFQREYSWQNKEIIRLLEQIRSAEGVGHFIGTIFTAYDGDREAVIDGQQRLTTLSLLFLAVHKRFRELCAPGSFDNQLDELRNFILISGDDVSAADLYSRGEKIKLRMQLSRQNNNDWDYVILVNDVMGKHVEVEPKIQSKYKLRKLYKAYKYISSWCTDSITSPDGCVELLFNIKRTRLVLLTAQDSTKASELFDGLNNTGLQLSISDIIKNKVLSAYRAIDAYSSIGIDSALDLWIRFVETLSPSVHTQYLRHFVHTLPVITETQGIVDTVGVRDKNLAEKYDELVTKSGRNKEKIIRKISEHAVTYNTFLNPNTSHSANAFEKQLHELRTIEGSPSYSLLLYLFEKRVDISILLQTTDLLCKLFARRHIANLPRVTVLDENITKAISHLEELHNGSNNITFSEIAYNLLGGYEKKVAGKTVMIDKSYIHLDDLTKHLLSDMYTQNTEITRYLLMKIASILHSPPHQSYDPFRIFLSFDQLRPGSERKLYTIEHVMPQTENLSEYWNASLRRTARSQDLTEWQVKHIHKLGNLTLTADNSKLSDKDFPDKQKLGEVVHNGTKYSIGYKNGDILNRFVFPVINDSIPSQELDKEELVNNYPESASLENAPFWDTTLINSRTQFMVNVLIEALKLPNEQ